jgi:hypothetical protein
MRRALVLGLAIAVLSACGGPASPTPTPVPPEARTATAAARAATATASAEVALLSKSPCLVDAETRDALRQLADILWQAGTNVGSDNAGLGLQFYEASIAYGILTDCRELGGTPVPLGSPAASGVGTPIVCIADAEAIRRLQDAATKGTVIIFQLVLVGDVEADDLKPVAGLNNLLIERARELEIACGLRPPGTPIPAASPAATPS